MTTDRRKEIVARLQEIESDWHDALDDPDWKCRSAEHCRLISELTRLVATSAGLTSEEE